MAILFTGGAGYIGSQCYYELSQTGEEIIVVDNLSTGNRKSLPEDVTFYECDIADKEQMNLVFESHEISTIFHFAGSLVVEESVLKPELYYKNNVVSSLNLIELAKKHQVNKIIFSSTAAVYGSQTANSVTELSPVSPENPYAFTKYVVENIIKDHAEAYGLNYIILRYFNVAGADPELRTGNYSKNATHLVKLACQTALGERESISIFGVDYDTDDGTCVRDYIHVADLANAHLLAYNYIMENKVCKEIFNCGYGKGYSVREIINVVEKVCGHSLNIKEANRRPGDPVSVVATADKIKNKIGWNPKYNDIEVIVKSALDWEQHLLAE